MTASAHLAATNLESDPGSACSFPVTLLGGAAHRALAIGSRWSVIAVFRRSFYCRDEAGSLICFGPPSIGAGPINAIAALDEAMNWGASGLRPGARAQIDDTGLRVDGRFVFPFADARRWRPATLPRRWTPLHLSRGLAFLGREIAKRAPSDGLAPIIPILEEQDLARPAGRAMQSFLTAAWAGITAFDAWLSAAFAGEKGGSDLQGSQAEVLIGLGAGLTPSGDDFLGGAMIALRALGQPAIADSVADWVLPLARTRTHPISFAHLACAAGGEGADAIHLILASLCRPGCPELVPALDGVAAIGHTSGWDALAGVVATCATCVASRGEDRALGLLGN